MTRERTGSEGGGFFEQFTVAQAQSTYAEWSGNIELTPSFLDEAARDFRLQSSSQAIDAGRAVSGYPFNGLAPDIGRYETGAAVPQAPSRLRISRLRWLSREVNDR